MSAASEKPYPAGCRLSASSTNSMSNLPPELLSYILVRLIPTDLVRSMCVCKDWYALIRSRHFIKAHLQWSIRTNSAPRTILFGSFNAAFFSAPYNGKFGTKAVRIEQPFSNATVVGSVHGLVCISDYKGRIIALWNPSIQKLKKIPSPTFESLASSSYSHTEHRYGFGYDSVNDDYKIVVMVVFQNANFFIVSSQVQIYSLKSNSWKTIQSLPCNGFKFAGYVTTVVFSNGGLSLLIHTGLEDTPKIVLTLDLATEKYSHCLTPVSRSRNFATILTALGDYLCICNNRCGSRKEFWIMKEYGVAESWTLLCSIEGIRNVCEAVAFSKYCERVLVAKNTGRLFWFNLKTKKIKGLQFHRVPIFMSPTICDGSLCLLDGESTSCSREMISNT